MGCFRLCGCSVQLKSDFGFSPSLSWYVSSPEHLPTSWPGEVAHQKCPLTRLEPCSTPKR